MKKKFTLDLENLRKIRKIKSFGHSMAPLLFDGDVVFFKKVNFRNIKVNDIVVVKKKHTYFAHRVIFKKDKYLITKGDNNLYSDGKIYPHQIISRIYKIKRNNNILTPETLYLIQSSLYFDEIVRIKKEFEREGVDFVFLKGLPLHLYYEKTHPRRFYFDCDILIKRSNFALVHKIFTKNGYHKLEKNLFRIQKFFKKSETEASYLKSINDFPVVFDLHLEAVFMIAQFGKGKFEFLYPQRLIEKLTNEFLKTKREVIINKEKFPILNPLFFILYLALHLFNHNFKGAFRFQFLHETIKKHRQDLNWNDLEKEIVDFKLTNFTNPVFYLLKRYYKTPLPQRFTKTVKEFTDFNIFNEETRIETGIQRFKNLFYFSPAPLYQKILVFFDPQIILTLLWVMWTKITGYFSKR